MCQHKCLAQRSASISCHKISKYIDYPNVKELFLSLRAEKERAFESPLPPLKGVRAKRRKTCVR